MLLLSPKKYQKGRHEHTWPQTGMRNPKETQAGLSLLFFLFGSKVLSVFALNGPYAHCFLPVPSMTPCFKFQGESQSGTRDSFFAGHDPAPSPISPFTSVSVPTTHSQTLSPQASAPWAPSTNGHSACFIPCGIFHNLVQCGLFFMYFTRVISVS